MHGANVIKKNRNAKQLFFFFESLSKTVAKLKRSTVLSSCPLALYCKLFLKSRWSHQIIWFYLYLCKLLGIRTILNEQYPIK